MTEYEKILVIGGGGREHAICAALKKSDRIKELFCAPGNGGTAGIATNVGIDSMDNDAVLQFCKKEKIDLVVVGTEGPLANGIVNHFEDSGIPILGPSQFAAQLESSKLFAREFMKKHKIPHPKFIAADSPSACRKAATKFGIPVVLKADGLAAGKGVIVCETTKDLEDGIDEIFHNKSFGKAGEKVSVEECLVGPELSIFYICDGENAVYMGNARDHKRIFDGDEGPNTGGMGAFSPSELATTELLQEVDQTIVRPTMEGMKKEGHPFVGFLYVGLMIQDAKPYVIEFNVRLGDPETQVVLPRLKTPFYKLCKDAVQQKLTVESVETYNLHYICLVLAAKGYPGSYEKEIEICCPESMKSGLIFHAGTKREDDELLSTGGRILNLVEYNHSLDVARKKVYTLAGNVKFSGKFYRSDIGLKEIE